MSNGPIKCCAAGVCCPPPLQQKALAVTLMEIAGSAESGGVGGLDTSDYMHLAGGLIERGLIGVSPEEAAHLKREASPTEAELDAMLAG